MEALGIRSCILWTSYATTCLTCRRGCRMRPRRGNQGAVSVCCGGGGTGRNQILRPPGPQIWRRWRTRLPSPLPPSATRKQHATSVALCGLRRCHCVLAWLTPLPMCIEPNKDTSFQHCRGIRNNKSKKKIAPSISYTHYPCMHTTE
jgi:hypothetical protein